MPQLHIFPLGSSLLALIVVRGALAGLLPAVGLQGSMLTADLIRVPARFEGVDLADLRRHIAFACSAMEHQGQLHVRIGTAEGELVLRRETRQTSDGYIVLRASTGYLGRAAVAVVHAHLATRGIEFKSRLTPKRGLLRDVQVQFPAGHYMTPQGVASLVGQLASLLGAAEPQRFQLTYWCSFSPSYEVRADDPVQPPGAARAGHALGVVLGQLTRSLRR